MFLGYTNPHVQERFWRGREKAGQRVGCIPGNGERFGGYGIDTWYTWYSQNVTVRNRWESRIRRCIYFGFKWSVCEGRLRMIVDGSK